MYCSDNIHSYIMDSDITVAIIIILSPLDILGGIFVAGILHNSSNSDQAKSFILYRKADFYQFFSFEISNMCIQRLSNKT